MTPHRYPIVAAAVAAVVLAGCGLKPPPPAPNPGVVIQGFLTPGAPVDNIELRRTVPPSEFFPYMSLAPYAISGANVVVTNDGHSYTLIEHADEPGAYGDPDLIAQAGQTYSVDVTFPDTSMYHDRHLTASTTVPSQVTASYTLDSTAYTGGATNIDTLYFPRELSYPDSFGVRTFGRPFGLSWNRASNVGGYVVALAAQDTEATNLLLKWQYDEWKNGNTSSSELRQRVQTRAITVLPDSLHLDWVWVAFAYAGRNDIVVVAADTNYFDFYRTATQGPSNTGNDYNTGVLSHVVGGLGVFGSYTADTLHTYIKAQWLPSANEP